VPNSGLLAYNLVMPFRLNAFVFIYLFIMKFVQLGTQIKTQCKKENIQKTQKVHYEVHKNHIIKSTSDSQNSEI